MDEMHVFSVPPSGINLVRYLKVAVSPSRCAVSQRRLVICRDRKSARKLSEQFG